MRFLVVFLCIFSSVYATNTSRVIAIDWTIAETMKALDYNPLAIGDKRSYSTWVRYPPLDDSVVDLGLRMQPNLEQLITLKPDLIIIPSFFGFNQSLLEQYAPLKVMDIYKGGDVYTNMIETTKEVAQLLSRENEARKLIKENEEIFLELSNQLQSVKSQIAVVQFIDTKQVRIYGENSIFGAGLNKLGLKNALPPHVITNLWGIAVIPVVELLRFPKDTILVIIEPIPFDLEEELRRNSLYRAIRLLDNKILLEPIWSAGGILSLQRFSKNLTQKILSQNNP